MALGRIVQEDQAGDAYRHHDITDLDENAMVLETTARNLVGFYYSNGGAGATNYLKFWNNGAVVPDTDQLGPDLVWPMDSTANAVEAVLFSSKTSAGVESLGIVEVFTSGMTVIATVTKASGNITSAVTQVAPDTASPEVIIITKPGS